jgi:DNA-binding Lrp family transcriptional regulator
MENFDDIDKKILNILQNNSKLTHKEIAEKLYLSRTPVFDRIKKLERKGVIKKYIALLNPVKINKNLKVLCFITLKAHGLEAVNLFQKEIEKKSCVMECFHIAGNYDFFLKVIVKDIEEYQKFVLNDLSEIKNISQVNSSFVLGELKYKLNFDL